MVRQQGRCHICGEPMSWDDPARYPTWDHIIPRSKGGSNRTANLALAHLTCNRRKANAGIRATLTSFTPCDGCMGPDRDDACLCA